MNRNHKLGIHNWTQTGKGTYIMSLFQKNEGSVKIKQRPIKMGGRTIYRTLSCKRTPFQTGTDRWPHLWMVPAKRRISHTHPMWFWGYSLFKISSPGPVLYGTKWLLWRPHKQSPTFHSKCRIDKVLRKKKGKHNRSMKITVEGLDYYDPPLMH
jgi:hypothetical protein